MTAAMVVGTVLAAWLAVSVLCAFALGAVVRRRDRQVPVVRLPAPAVIVIPEQRVACRAETEARIPSR